MMGRRELPHSPEAEQAVLGAVLLNPGCFLQVAEVLGMDAAPFYHPANGQVWKAMCGLNARLEPIDTTTLVNRLSAMGCLDAVGGGAYLG